MLSLLDLVVRALVAVETRYIPREALSANRVIDSLEWLLGTTSRIAPPAKGCELR